LISQEIESVIIRLARAYDEREFDVMGELLADDVRLELPATGSAPESGREAVLAYFDKLTSVRAEEGREARHVVTNIRVEPLEDGVALARSHVALLVTEPDGSTGVHATATYEDRFVLAGGAWRLASRRLEMN
jgi:3-phenylpropionate/cinnamic acid dioxygenase small subunit